MWVHKYAIVRPKEIFKKNSFILALYKWSCVNFYMNVIIVQIIKIEGYERVMSTWKSRGLRGSLLEEMINRTNEKYRQEGLALIQKIPTPIKPIEIDPQKHHITLAYFEQKSTVDYIGVVQGIPVCFDAKECASGRFPLANIHPHQIAFMEEFEKQEGMAFILIYFKEQDIFYYLTFRRLKEFWERCRNGGRKSFSYEELDPHYQISTDEGVMIHYLDMIQQDLLQRDEDVCGGI